MAVQNKTKLAAGGDLRSRERSVTWPTVVVFAILIVVQELPAFQRRVGGYTIFIPLALLFLLFAFRTRIRIKRSNLGLLVSSAVYLTISVLYRFVGISTAGYGWIVHSVMYLVIFTSMDVVQRMDHSQKRFILFVIVLAMLTEILLNIREFNRLGSYYYLIHKNESDLNATSVASTQYLTAIMLMSGMLFFMWLHDKKRGRRALWGVLTVVCILFNLLIMQRMIVLLLSVFMFALIFIYNSRHKLVVDLLILLLVILFAVLLLNYQAVFAFFSNLIKSDRLTVRLNQIARAMSMGSLLEGGGSLTARFNLYLVSLRTWTSSLRTFFFGAGEHVANNSIIGNHSQFFDVLARFGLIGGFCMYYFVGKTLSALLHLLPISKGTSAYKQILVILWAFVIRGLLGGVVYGTIALRLFVVLPILFSLLSEREASANEADPQAPAWQPTGRDDGEKGPETACG